METIIDQAKAGMPVLGICNGFQVLIEAHLLPGAMLRNTDLHFVCRDQRLRVETADTAWTADYAEGQEISIPLKNIDGRYIADERTLDELEAEGRVVFRYAGALTEPRTARCATSPASPTRRGNVVGLMPHPEHAVEPLTGTGRTDGLGFFTSVLKKLVTA